MVALVVAVPVFIIVAMLLQNAGRASAQVSSFYPTTCLGGWKNTEKATGAPDARGGEAEQYGDANSASISNVVAQIYCGGFTGEIPADTLQKKIFLRFSWALKNPEATSVIHTEPAEQQENENEHSTLPAEASLTVPEPTLEPQSEAVSEEATAAQEEETQAGPSEALPAEHLPVPQESPTLGSPAEARPESPVAPEEPTALNMFFSTAYAQEIKVEEEAIAASTADDAVADDAVLETNMKIQIETEAEAETPSTIPASALLEVLYTLDGNNWQTIGHVSHITNDLSFAMPMDIFATIEDLARVQIAIRTTPTFDSVPTIYLDSVWLDVEYQKIPVTKGISGFKVFILTQEMLEPALNDWFAAQKGIVVDDLKVENYGGGGYLIIASYHAGGTDDSTVRFKLIAGENPAADAQTFLSSLNASQTVRSISATTGSYSGSETTVTVPLIFIVYE